MQLVIAEKPSVAMSIASVLGATDKKDGYTEGNGYLVSWCVGHLVELADAAHYGDYQKWRYEDLPILPEHWQYVVTPDKQKQFQILKELMHRSDISEIICATDAGREGELIFRFVYDMAGCEKPILRLWISSMEESAIRKGFDTLKDGHAYDSLYHSALCRAKADWLIGINATRLFSVLYRHTLNVGRVQTPTLFMLVQRDEAIRSFQKEKYYLVRIGCDGIEAVSEPFRQEQEAKDFMAACSQSPAICTGVKKETKTVNPPKIFDLTTLQREANRLFSYTAKQTLDYTQSLYEKKMCTYPRTDSQYLSDDMLPTVESLVSGLRETVPFAKGLHLTPDYQRILNSKKVTDHHAIIPTAEMLKTDLAALPETERRILYLIVAKLLCAVSAPYRYEAVSATFSCAGKELTAKGKTVLHAGFKEVEHSFRSFLKAQPEDETDEAADKELPQLSEGQVFESVAAKMTEHFTTPPKPFTEDTLLSAMERAGTEDMTEDVERKGLGTPATRAAIIEKLVQAGFIERKKKQLIPTKNGINLITVLPETLTSPKLTAEWENELSRIAGGESSPEDFLDGIEQMAAGLVQTYSFLSVPEETRGLFQTEKEVIGQCPRCGSPVYEGKKNFYCSNKECRFCLWKNNRFFESKKKTLTKQAAAALLKSGKVKMKGLYSEKTGKTYDATVILDDTGDKYVNFKLEFPKKN